MLGKVFLTNFKALMSQLWPNFPFWTLTSVLFLDLHTVKQVLSLTGVQTLCCSFLVSRHDLGMHIVFLAYFPECLSSEMRAAFFSLHSLKAQFPEFKPCGHSVYSFSWHWNILPPSRSLCTSLNPIFFHYSDMLNVCVFKGLYKNFMFLFWEQSLSSSSTHLQRR